MDDTHHREAPQDDPPEDSPDGPDGGRKPDDPRLSEVGEQGSFPAEFVDTPENVPGDQPIDDEPPPPPDDYRDD